MRKTCDNSGVFGVFSTFEPADLDFYSSCLPPTLAMPEKPLVNCYMADVGLTRSRLTRFFEGGVLLLCERDGEPGWAEVGVPINNIAVYIYATILMGSRKLMAQRVGLRQEGDNWIAEVERLSKGWKLEFTPRPLSELGELEPWQEAWMAGEKHFAQINEPRFMVSKISRKVHVLDWTPIFPGDRTTIQTGTARLTVDPGQELSRLVKSGSEAPAVYLKVDRLLLRDFVQNAWSDGVAGSRISKIPALIGLEAKPPVRWGSNENG
ncbi:MAG: hypothetical protein JW854_17415 [Actinobacteria bacterium]|nr:hypothetical protein [Actinomycetota bacterium]